ncbi:MAG: hypothetical protein CSA82_02245 [Actinobacteria bacterium]|nr:MAG: hypothetical protein CSA82_02245 [Actinomycetota bacterium]
MPEHSESAEVKRSRQYREEKSFHFPLRWVSPLVVVVAALMVSISVWKLDSLWPIVGIVSVCAALIAWGWRNLVGIPLALPSQIVIVAAGTAAGISVALTRDQMSVTFVMGIAMVVLIAVEVWLAPTPRNYTEQETSHSQAPYDTKRQKGDDVRKSWSYASTTSAVAASATALLIAVGGSGWVALAFVEGWRILVPMAAVVVAFVVGANQVGHSWVLQSLMAVVAGVLSGAVGALFLRARSGNAFSAVVLPVISTQFGDAAAIAIFGAFSGASVAVAVSIVDALLGNHRKNLGGKAAFGRGAVKFLVAGLTIYALVRIGGI